MSFDGVCGFQRKWRTNYNARVVLVFCFVFSPCTYCRRLYAFPEPIPTRNSRRRRSVATTLRSPHEDQKPTSPAPLNGKLPLDGKFTGTRETAGDTAGTRVDEAPSRNVSITRDAEASSGAPPQEEKCAREETSDHETSEPES